MPRPELRRQHSARQAAFLGYGRAARHIGVNSPVDFRDRKAGEKGVHVLLFPEKLPSQRHVPDEQRQADVIVAFTQPMRCLESQIPNPTGSHFEECLDSRLHLSGGGGMGEDRFESGHVCLGLRRDRQIDGNLVLRYPRIEQSLPVVL